MANTFKDSKGIEYTLSWNILNLFYVCRKCAFSKKCDTRLTLNETKIYAVSHCIKYPLRSYRIKNEKTPSKRFASIFKHSNKR